MFFSLAFKDLISAFIFGYVKVFFWKMEMTVCIISLSAHFQETWSANNSVPQGF
jgi:hypothetical protein